MRIKPRLRSVQRVAGTVAVGLIAGAGFLSAGPAMEFSQCGGSLQCVIPAFWVAVVTAAVCMVVAAVALYPSAAYNRAGVRRTTERPAFIAVGAGVGWIAGAGMVLYYVLGQIGSDHPGLPVWFYAAAIALGLIAVGPLVHWIVGVEKARH